MSVYEDIVRRRIFHATPEQIERGFLDMITLSVCFAYREPCKLTQSNIERRLLLMTVHARRIRRRRDFTPSLDQIERGLTDEDGYVSADSHCVKITRQHLSKLNEVCLMLKLMSDVLLRIV